MRIMGEGLFTGGWTIYQVLPHWSKTHPASRTITSHKCSGRARASWAPPSFITEGDTSLKYKYSQLPWVQEHPVFCVWKFLLQVAPTTSPTSYIFSALWNCSLSLSGGGTDVPFRAKNVIVLLQTMSLCSNFLFCSVSPKLTVAPTYGDTDKYLEGNQSDHVSLEKQKQQLSH